MSFIINKEKEQLRKLLLQKRKDLSQEYRKKATLRINLLLYKIAVNYNVIATFQAFGSEIDISLCNKLLLLAGKKLMLPKISGDQMGFVNICEIKELLFLFKGNLSFYEPLGNFTKLNLLADLIIVPGLGYDQYNNRMGYGKGFYDKFLVNFNDIFKVMPAFAAQKAVYIPHDELDVKMDLVVDENLLIKGEAFRV